jgi:type VI secretion system protein ImpL
MFENLVNFSHLFNVISDISHIIAPHYPILIIGLIFIAVIVLLILLFWLFKAIRRNLMRIKWPKSMPEDSAASALLTPEEKLERSTFYKLKKMFGLVAQTTSDELSRAFEQMKFIVEDMVGGPDPLYKMPLYLVIGGQGSAKKSILDQASLGNPFELDMINYRIQEMKKYWWFYDQAMVLKAPGACILEKDSGQSDIRLWRHLVSLLERYRPQRPLDGVILTIPCDELIGKNKLDQGLIVERARTLYNKLLQLQTSCGISVPVYVVVTKTDAIFGFESFCREIPAESLNEIFGWSSPYGTTQTYSSSWLSQGFHQMEARLQHIALEIYTENPSVLEADGLYVFSTSFREIQNTLDLYLSEIFKTSPLHDPMMFRGVYFTGDATIPEYEGTELSSIVKNVQRPDKFTGEKKLQLYFLKELFTHKIFLEYSLARATHRSIKHNKSTLNAAKTVLLLLVLAGTVDTLSLHYSMSAQKGSLLNHLREIEIMIQDADNLQEKAQKGFDQEKFEEQGKFLIHFINLYENTRFFSPLVPATWFSNPSKKIEAVLAIAFDHLVLKSLSFDLKLKAEKIMKGMALDSILDAFDSPGLTKTKHFVVFNTFIKDIEDFEKNIAKYNEFTGTKDRIYLEPVVSYLFGTKIPKSFFEHISGQISESLKWGEYMPIELDTFKEFTRERFEIFLNLYLNSIFSAENYAVLKYQDLENSLENLGGRLGTSAASIEEIQKLETKANKTAEVIEHNDFKWLNKTKLDFDADLDKLSEKINNSKLLGRPFAQEFKQRASNAFIRFKEDLPNVGLNLTGSIFALEKGVSIATPSESFKKLQKSLAELSKEAFILKTEAKKDITPPPPGKIVMWDMKTLLHASNLITSYDQFIQNKLSNYPPQLQNVVQSIGLRALQINVMNLVIKSMVMETPPKAPSLGSPEEALKPIIENLKNATPHLSRIIPILNSEGVGNNFLAFQSVIVTQYYDTLMTLDGIFQKDGLYSIKDGNFDWWRGDLLVNAKAFSASDIDDLKVRLHIQADRVKFLVKEFGIPLLTILQTQGLQISPISFPILGKWTRILDQSLGYEKKQPDSTMMILENYLLSDLAAITSKNCTEKLTKPGTTAIISGDFFAALKQTISKKLYDRCYRLNLELAIKSYSKLIDFFNNRLAGKFPFTEDNSSADEAKDEDIQKLFKLFEEAGGNADKIIAGLPETESSLQQARPFLKALEEMRAFFAGFVGDKPILKAPSFMLNISFRANREQEIGASSIVDWFFSVGKTTVSSRSKETRIPWSLGNPIMVSFKWAEGGTLKPAYDATQPGMSIQDKLAAFSITSKWSLVKAIRLFSAGLGELGSGKDALPHMLRFTVPTLTVPSSTIISDRSDVVQGKPGETARVYVQVEIETVKAAGGESTALPGFPTGAPILSDETKALIEPPKPTEEQP